MFIDTEIVLISNENFDAANKLTELGITNEASYDLEDFEYRRFRFRIDDIKSVYESIENGLLVIDLYESDKSMIIRDDITRITDIMDAYYSIPQGK